MKAHSRQIESQRVESEREITGSEAEEILRKYGHGEPQKFSTFEEPKQIPSKPQTFEEMVAQQEAEENARKNREISKIRGPKPITFDGGSGYESEIKHGMDDELGFGFTIQVSSDMKIPK